MESMMTISEKEQRRAEVMALLVAGKLLQREAAEQLDIDPRHVRRLLHTYKKSGAVGLISRKRGQPSNNQLNTLLADQIIARVRERYPDFGPTLAHEKLTEEDGYRVSLSSVRRLMEKHGIWLSKKRKKEAKVHPRRDRRPRFGELVQIDGSHHDWFEGRAPKCCLIVFIDDATGAFLGLRFAPEETLFSYFMEIETYLKKYGRPLAFYSDKHGIFRVNHGAAMETSLTQFGRAMKELDIRSICAHSPEAKGRVERGNGTLQDRLVKELRLQNISTIEDANNFLPEYCTDLNSRFAIAPTNPVDAHRALEPHHDLERTLSVKESRRVSKTLSFQLDNTHYQIIEEGWRTKEIAGSTVEVVRSLKGTIRVFYGNRELTYTEMKLVRNRPKTLDSKEVNSEFDRWLNKKEKESPSGDHPWRKQL